ncbi:hypothetical protein GCM10012275_41680 [Longimycelium tulufanense]|uniref:VWFA domain-containing protein n=1 Tax=Longimycelium tulufanense TaxID=907463 RepID=A0A8J3FXX8_9PSEU|nr:M64 family metallopeptidase [Longimycelium tulufanense]GGM66887.1 hypothetical protein GCM10012275_41680 [Longimycelium tulufanense]
MGTADGSVTGITKILDNGPDSELCNIVLVAEGFTTSEQGDFADLCNDFVAALQDEPWFPVMGGAINVHRLDVVSDESGADDPKECDDGSEGDDVIVDTYFDAQFCSSGIRRCLNGDVSLVRTELDARLPEWHVATVLVNTTDFGGCASGNVNFSSTHSGWEAVALHELGHSAFGLADEYPTWEGCDSGETDRDLYEGSDPNRPNITTVTNRSTLKWRHLLTPGVPVPTMQNPDCSECDERPNVLDDDDKIGLFEGAGYYHCGLHRPAYRCRMRSSSDPFCKVCLEAIAVDLSDFAAATPVLEVVPTAIDFGEIAYGLTQYRLFEVRNVRSGHPVPLDVTLTPPTGEFSYAPGTELTFTLPAPIFEAYSWRHVFVAFTSTPTGGPTFTGEAAVTAGEPGAEQSVTVDLQATAVPPPPVDSTLVLDRSASMSEETGEFGQTKIDHTLQAARLYVSLLKENDRIGIVRYHHRSDDSDIMLTMRVAGPLGGGAGRTAAMDALDADNFTPDGTTSIGGGIINGSGVLDDGVADSRALVVLTDGRQNTPPDIPAGRAEVETKTPRQRVFAVGLGLNQLEDKLNEIASVTGGVAQITGDLVDEREFLLRKLFVQILSDVSDEAFVRDPRQFLGAGQRQATPVWLGEVDVACDFIVTWRPHPFQQKFPRVWLEAPDGTIIDEAAAASAGNINHVRHATHLYYRVLFPLRPDTPFAHAGRWRVWAEMPTTVIEHGGLIYSVMAKARSDLRLGGHLVQAEYQPGSAMTVVLEPTLFGLPIRLDPPVRVEVTRPDGAHRTLTLLRDDTGTYTGIYNDTPLVGPYGFDTEVSATTPAGYRVTRYRHLTGLIYVRRRPEDGDKDECPDGKDDDWVRTCKEARRALRFIDDVLVRCCTQHRPPRPPPRPPSPGLRRPPPG